MWSEKSNSFISKRCTCHIHHTFRKFDHEQESIRIRNLPSRSNSSSIVRAARAGAITLIPSDLILFPENCNQKLNLVFTIHKNKTESTSNNESPQNGTNTYIPDSVFEAVEAGSIADKVQSYHEIVSASFHLFDFPKTPARWEYPSFSEQTKHDHWWSLQHSSLSVKWHKIKHTKVAL